eukprot:TRINITY_DN970_c0_g3_i2.p1 TRINITY_DN970_c0_g3~~TRINITY_DN970_c0_g3_i2.p1  ORF type:complete len:234 (-),score=4.71 TRINITY_DN970_c0_g3_i2:83-784(-)
MAHEFFHVTESTVDEPSPATKLVFTVPHNSTPFCLWANSNPVGRFFREVTSYLEQQRNIMHYHLRVVPDDTHGFAVEIFTGERLSGPKPRPVCISCDLSFEAAISTLICETEYHRCWFDAKARLSFVITPKRHIFRLSEMEDEELQSFWFDAVRLLENEFGSIDVIRFMTIVVNHGDYRNLEHVHMKLRFDKPTWSGLIQRWSPERLAQLHKIEEQSRDPNLALAIGAQGVKL